MSSPASTPARRTPTDRKAPTTRKAPTPKAAPAASMGAGWLQNAQSYVFTTPSGTTCALRKPSLQTLVEAGLLDSFDQLSSTVNLETIKKAEGGAAAIDIAAVRKDPEQMKKMLELVDKIVQYVVVDPILHTDPADDMDRVEGDIYLSYVDFQDKAAIMEEAVGSLGLSDFDAFRP